ncbi:MAG: SAM-dependent methyltransferase [Deltaproteobacteria bacterium]|nr:SAM-dependent methyltransferase [Deltaproteobacteria bacterium]
MPDDDRTDAPINVEQLCELLSRALTARAQLFEPKHETALRLFNGFSEGCLTLVIDLYARTLVLHDYAEGEDAGESHAIALTVQTYLRAQLPWVQAVLLKRHRSPHLAERQGVLLFGERVDRHIREHGVRYALELQLHGEASFYLDTRNLRAWALRTLTDKTVLNTFAYTGSLGVAAVAGGARRVVHLDHNKSYLNVAKASYSLNGFPIEKANFQGEDFWTQGNLLKRAEARFDCALLDPPFFSTTSGGTVDLVNHSERVINKVRPLINDGGYLVAINNALFVSGAAYLQMLELLCADGYLSIEEFIPVPLDCTGYPLTVVSTPPVDPAPFNHPTKIVVLRVRRK